MSKKQKLNDNLERESSEILLDEFQIISRFEVGMFKRLAEKRDVYAQTWKTIDRGKLVERLVEQVGEYLKAVNDGDLNEQEKKLVDIANLCWMNWIDIVKLKQSVQEFADKTGV